MIEFFEILGNVLCVSATLVLGTTIASFLVAQTMYTQNEIETNDVDKDISSSEEEEEEEPDFITLYSLEDKESRELSSAEKEALKNKHCKVETPAGEVLMTYEDPFFMYYAKSGSIIPYRFLDVVARKFVLDNDCVTLYKKIEIVKEDEPKEEEKKDEGKNEENKPVENSVFVKKKKPVTKKNVVTKTMNKFKYCGQISDYENKPREEKKEAKKMTFSDYKKMMNNQ